jgi:hypothetical protein
MHSAGVNNSEMIFMAIQMHRLLQLVIDCRFRQLVVLWYLTWHKALDLQDAILSHVETTELHTKAELLRIRDVALSAI